MVLAFSLFFIKIHMNNLLQLHRSQYIVACNGQIRNRGLDHVPLTLRRTHRTCSPLTGRRILNIP